MAAGHRILVNACVQEVSTFNPVPSGTDDFDIWVGEPFFAAHRGHETEIGGALAVFEAAGVEAIPGFGAWALSSAGTLGRDAFRELADGFLAAVRANPDVDGIYACLHGSMVADDEADPEGYLLEETRRIVGDTLPIVISLDLHGVLTRRMLREADAVVCYWTYPHVDQRQTGERAARLLLRILDAGVRPVTARVTIPALVRGEELITETGSFGRLTRRAAVARDEPGRARCRDAHQQSVHRRPGAHDERLRHDRWRPGPRRRRGARPGARVLGRPRGDGPATHLARRGGRSGEGDDRPARSS